MLLLLLVFACTHEQEDIKTSDEQVYVKGEINQESDIAYRTDAVTFTVILTSQHSYMYKKDDN